MKSNSTQTEYAQTFIHQLVQAVVELSPNTKAVVFEQSRLTYRQFSSRANNLLHYLQALSVGKEVLVGICMERSLEMLVGLLAFKGRTKVCRTSSKDRKSLPCKTLRLSWHQWA